jgi:hypothetical protein
MRVAGGIIALIGGVFAVIAALCTLSVGGVASALNANNAGMVVTLGWLGLALSFVTIVLGAVACGVQSRTPGQLLILTSLIAAIAGGTLVAICMTLVLAGGILAAIGGGKPKAFPATT